MLIDEAARMFRVVSGMNATAEDLGAVTIGEAERFIPADAFYRFVELNGIRMHEGILR